MDNVFKLKISSRHNIFASVVGDFIEISQKFEQEQVKATCLNLESFLVMPVQRVPRYLLLLRVILQISSWNIQVEIKLETEWVGLVEIYKCSTCWQESHSASGRTHRERDVQDQRVHRQERNWTCIQDHRDWEEDWWTFRCKPMLISHIVWSSVQSLVAPKRRYVREGKLIIKPVTNEGSSYDALKKSQQNPYWFLLNDTFVCCEKKSKDEHNKLFDFRTVIPLSSIKAVEEIKKEPKMFSKFPKDTSFELILRGETLKVNAPTVKDKVEWMNQLIILVWLVHQMKLMSLGHGAD